MQDERHRYLHGRGQELQQYLGRRANRTPSPGLLEETTQDGRAVLDSDEETVVGPGPAEGQAGPSNWQQTNGHPFGPEDFGTMNGHLNGDAHSEQESDGDIDGAGRGPMNGHPVGPWPPNGYRLGVLLPPRFTDGTELYPGPANFIQPDGPLRNGHVPSPPMTSPTSPEVIDQLRAGLNRWLESQDAENALTTDGAYPRPTFTEPDPSQLPALPPSVDGLDEVPLPPLVTGGMDGLAALQPVADGIVPSTGTNVAAGNTRADRNGGNRRRRANRTNGVNGHEPSSAFSSSSSSGAEEPSGVSHGPAEEHDDDDDDGAGGVPLRDA